MPKNDNRLGRLPRRSKHPRITTVNDLLTRDKVNDILNDLNKVKTGIRDLIVIYTDKDTKYHCLSTDDTLCSTATWLLESVKHDLMHSED